MQRAVPGRHVVSARFCQHEFVEHGEDEAVKEDRVEEDHEPSRLVADDEADEGQDDLQGEVEGEEVWRR